jgi:hypothetical protein
MSAAGGTKQWISHLLRVGSKLEKKRNLGTLITFWWNIWKKRRESLTPTKWLAHLVIENVSLHESVLGH